MKFLDKIIYAYCVFLKFKERAPFLKTKNVYSRKYYISVYFENTDKLLTQILTQLFL